MTLTGTGNPNLSANNQDVSIGGTVGNGTSSGNITLKGNSLTLDAGSHLQSSGTLTVQPRTDGTTIGIAGGSGTLSISASAFSSNFTNGFSGITIGSSTAGDINIGNTALTYYDPLTLKTRDNIIFAGGAGLTGTSGENAHLVLWANAGSSGAGYISLPGTSASPISINTQGGGLWMGGGSGSASWTPKSGASAITVGDGYATGTASQSLGVFLRSATITTGGGNIAIYGDSGAVAAAGGDYHEEMNGIHFGCYPT